MLFNVMKRMYFHLLDFLINQKCFAFIGVENASYELSSVFRSAD